MDVYIGSNKEFAKAQSYFSAESQELGLGAVTYSGRCFKIEGRSGEFISVETQDYVVHFDGYINGKNEKDIFSLLGKFVIKETDFIDSFVKTYDGLYNVVIRNKRTNDITLFSDPSALIPLYYCVIDEQFYFSSHQHVLAKFLNCEPNYVGVAEEQIFGYTLGGTTVYDRVSRINPGEIIKFLHKKNQTISSYQNVYYSNYKDFSNKSHLVYEIFDRSFKKAGKVFDTLGLMLSEGFDSRFLGIIAKENSIKIKSYTHSTPNSFGRRVVDSVSRFISEEHRFDDLESFPNDYKRLYRQYVLANNLNFPVWIHGSEYFGDSLTDSPVMVGTALDSTLGGHAFCKNPNPIFPAVRQRYFEIFVQNIGLLSSAYIEKLSRELLNSFKVSDARMNGIKKEIYSIYKIPFADKIYNEATRVNDLLVDEFKRIQASSSEPSQVLQRFFLENRARKFAFGQELTLRINNKIFIPSYEYSVMSVLSAITPLDKLNHKLYFEVMRSKMKRYSSLGNGNYGVSHRYPRLMLETLRFIHKYLERKSFRKLLKKRGNLSPSKFRSAFLTDYLNRDEATCESFMEIIRANDKVLNIGPFQSYFTSIKDYKRRTFIHSKFYKSLVSSFVFLGK